MNYRTPVYYGFIIALCASILMLSLVGLDMLGPDAVSSNKEMIGGTLLFLMIYLFLLFGIYFALKKQKDEGKGLLSFKKAMLQGVATSLSAAAFSVLFTFLFYELAYPEYVPELISALREKMELENVALEKIEEKLTERRAYYRTLNQALYSFIGNLITGIAFTLLLSFFLKTNRT